MDVLRCLQKIIILSLIRKHSSDIFCGEVMLLVLRLELLTWLLQLLLEPGNQSEILVMTFPPHRPALMMAVVQVRTIPWL